MGDLSLQINFPVKSDVEMATNTQQKSVMMEILTLLLMDVVLLVL